MTESIIAEMTLLYCPNMASQPLFEMQPQSAAHSLGCLLFLMLSR